MKYDLENCYVERAAYRLANDMMVVLSEVSNANVILWWLRHGGTAGPAIAWVHSNCLNAIMTAGAKLTANGCEMDKTWALASISKDGAVALIRSNSCSRLIQLSWP